MQGNSCSDEAISEYIEEASFQPNSDDISMFEWWSRPPVFDAPLEMPKGLLCKEEEQKLDVHWEPVEGATRYEINLRNRDGETVEAAFVEMLHHCFQADVYQKGAHRLCIRAFRNDEPGEWSCADFANLRLLSVPAQTQAELPVRPSPDQKVTALPKDTSTKKDSSPSFVTIDPPPVHRIPSGTGPLPPPAMLTPSKKPACR